MIVEIAYMFGASFGALVVGAVVAKGLLGRGFFGNVATQIAFGGLFGYVLMSAGVLSFALAIGIPVSIIISKILTRMYFQRRQHNALAGKYGEETKWIAEMVNEGDDEFKEAVKRLRSIDKREIAIEAESKEELREMTIERAEEVK